MSLIEDNRIGIIGLGQIGGSIAGALRKSNSAIEICAFDMKGELLAEGIKRNIIDRIVGDCDGVIKNSDIVIIALPIVGIKVVLETHSEGLAKKKLVTDTGSLKEEIVAIARKCGLSNFIGGHPLAGSERRGSDAWDSNLFTGKNWFFAGSESDNEETVVVFHSLIEAIGSKPIEVSSIEHDRMFALTSNLPHLFAFLLKDMYHNIPSEEPDKRLFNCSSFHGATRIADSDPEMVHQMLWHNRKHLKSSLEECLVRLSRACSYIDSENESDFCELFKNL